MRHIAKASVLCLALTAAPAFAGTYSDEMGKCLVAHSSAEDQTDLILWLFAAMARHPAVKPYATISDDQRAAIDLKGGKLVERLLTVDCRSETVTALKYEGSSAFENSFSLLGQVAMRGLMADPSVAESMGALARGIDGQKIKELYTEAGVPPDGSPAH